MLTLHTTDGGSWFKPGELIEGRASWHFDEIVGAVEVRLFWYTSAKAHRMSELFVRSGPMLPTPRATATFRFRVPEGPYSFSGKLITLAWAIELVALPSGETERLDLRIGPQPVEGATSHDFGCNSTPSPGRQPVRQPPC